LSPLFMRRKLARILSGRRHIQPSFGDWTRQLRRVNLIYDGAIATARLQDPKMEWRWLAPAAAEPDPSLNMALDQAIFEAHADSLTAPTIRVYGWYQPTVTIGRFQSVESVPAYWSGLPVLRRPTGGRAVRHGDDLTISIAVREALVSDRRTRGGVLSMYSLLLEGALAGLRACGLSLCSGSNAPRRPASADCFASAARCDVKDQKTGRKILGSALLRARNTVLLQMSLQPLQEVNIFGVEFGTMMKEAYARTLGASAWAECQDVTDTERARALELLYSSVVKSPKIEANTWHEKF
jgi:lipoate-protein ligase A